LFDVITFSFNNCPCDAKHSFINQNLPKMKNLIVALLLVCSHPAFSQWCNRPNPNFCPGNYFQNGDFETVTGNPNATPDQDINLATGWQAMWGAGSLADLHCTGGSVSIGTAPTPNSNVYAGIWIQNSPANTNGVVWREGMYNKLTSAIGKNTGSYSFIFKIANAQLAGTSPANPIRIGIYGVYNPSNTPASAPTGLNYNPSNLNLWANSGAIPPVQVVLLGTVSPPAIFTNAWVSQTVTFNSNDPAFPSTGIDHIMIAADDLFNPATKGKLYVNFDEFCLQKSKFCCPGENLVVNGDFEAPGNTGMSSNVQYTYNPAVATGATVPGQYNIVNGTEALAINRCWVAQDPSTCTNTSGKFLVVNGQTCGGKKVVWEQNFTVKDWECYEFCASVKDLKECRCDFDIKPNIEVVFSMPGIGNITQSVNVGPGACNWFQIKKQICLWGYGSSLNVKIVLDESVPGDGNDLALDNIALIAIPRCPPPVFQVTTTPINATTYSIAATATPSPSCPFLHWEVCEYIGPPGTGSCIPASNMVSPQIWWNLATNSFATYNGDGATTPPYNPTTLPYGVFVYGKMYRILLATWGECDGWVAFTRYIASSPRTKKVQIFTEEELKKNPEAVLKALK
jgi:hypothetical protein